MSESTQYTNFQDLYEGLLRRVRISTGVSATDTQAKHYINVALQDLHLGFDYKLPWCERSAVLYARTPYSTGTVSITKGSTAVVGVGTSWGNVELITVNVGTNSRIIFAGQRDIYRISTVDSTTGITLSSPYIGDTLSGASYVIYDETFSLDGNFLRPIDFQSFSPQMGISLIGRHDFRRLYNDLYTTGRPRVACIIDEAISPSLNDNIRRVKFYPYVNTAYRIPYSFVTSTVAVSAAGASLTSMASTTDTPTMPLRYRHAIIFHALYHWYRDRKDDARAQLAKEEYTDIMQRIVGDHDIGTHTTAHIQPRGGYLAATKRPYSYRTGGRVYDINDEFDSFRR